MPITIKTYELPYTNDRYVVRDGCAALPERLGQ